MDLSQKLKTGAARIRLVAPEAETSKRVHQVGSDIGETPGVGRLDSQVMTTIIQNQPALVQDQRTTQECWASHYNSKQTLDTCHLINPVDKGGDPRVVMVSQATVSVGTVKSSGTSQGIVQSPRSNGSRERTVSRDSKPCTHRRTC